MNWDTAFGIGAFVTALLAVLIPLKGKSHTEYNLDAETINKYLDAIDKSQKNYDALAKRLEDYKAFAEKKMDEMQLELDRLSNENIRLKVENTELKVKVANLEKQINGGKNV